MIFIDGSDSEEVVFIAGTSEGPVGMDGNDNSPSFWESTAISEGDRAAYMDVPFNKDQQSDWDVRHFVRYFVRIKLQRSSITCVHVFLGGMTILSLEDL